MEVINFIIIFRLYLNFRYKIFWTYYIYKDYDEICVEFNRLENYEFQMWMWIRINFKRVSEILIQWEHLSIRRPGNISTGIVILRRLSCASVKRCASTPNRSRVAGITIEIKFLHSQISKKLAKCIYNNKTI